METEKKLTLALPLKANGKLLTELTIRRPKVKDQLAAQKAVPNPEDQELRLLALLTGLAPDDFSEMDYGDYIRLQWMLEDFLPKRPANSARP